MSYRYDVFISYRRHAAILKWIEEEFIELFKEQVEVVIGRTPDVYWDETSAGDGDIATTQVIDALRHSCCLVSILSKPYFLSKWCAAEWHTFRLRAERVNLEPGATLTVPIQWQDGKKGYAELLRGEGPKPRDFTTFRNYGPGWRASVRHMEYQDEVMKLAESVAELLDDPPEFDPSWPLVRPEEVQLGDLSPGKWPYKLAKDPAAEQSDR